MNDLVIRSYQGQDEAAVIELWQQCNLVVPQNNPERDIHYIEREKKNLLATDLGRYLIALVRDRDLKSPELTGQWEAKLRQIESGGLAPERFMEAIAEYTAQIIRSGEAAVVD